MDPDIFAAPEDPDAEMDIDTFYDKQLKLEFVRASYIVITYLTQEQPAFTQTDIEKFITYIIARSFSKGINFTPEAKFS